MAEALSEHRMDGKVAIVTGAGSRADGIGNGRAASILMARAGAKVLLPATSLGEQGTIALIEDLDGNTVGLHAERQG